MPFIIVNHHTKNIISGLYPLSFISPSPNLADGLFPALSASVSLSPLLLLSLSVFSLCLSLGLGSLVGQHNSSSPTFEYGVPRRSVSFGEHGSDRGQRGPESVRTPEHRYPAISRCELALTFFLYVCIFKFCSDACVSRRR